MREQTHGNKKLYLGDNCGEIVFDRLPIEQLPSKNVTFVVRGDPIINDATMADARETGVNELVTVIDNGSNIPGTVLEKCSKELRDCFEHAGPPERGPVPIRPAYGHR